MKGWLESLVGPEYAAALLWTIVALIVLLVLLIAIRIVRGLSIGTFVAGGRNRKTRLAVMDATAVDSHRRLVLVRRDDIEHLILIGGPTDVVVEQNIRMASPTRRAADDGYGAHGHAHPQEAPFAHDHAHAPAAPAQPRPAAPVHAPAPARAAPHPAPPAAPLAAPPAAPVRSEPRLAPQGAAAVAPAAPRAAPPHQPAPVQTPSPPPSPQGVQPMRPIVAPRSVTEPVAPPAAPEVSRKADLDDALLRELEVSLDGERPARTAPPQPAAPAAAPQPAAHSLDAALDEEMSKLLRDLAGNKP